MFQADSTGSGLTGSDGRYSRHVALSEEDIAIPPEREGMPDGATSSWSYVSAGTGVGTSPLGAEYTVDESERR